MNPSSSLSLIGERMGSSDVPPNNWFLWRGGSVAVRSVPFARRCVESTKLRMRSAEAGLCRKRKIDALGDERGELVLVVAAARDDDREVRELLVDLGDEVLGVVIGERGVDQQHGVAGSDHEVGRVRRIVGAPDAVDARERVAQEVDERRVGRQHDDVRAVRLRRGLVRLQSRVLARLRCAVRCGVLSRRMCGIRGSRCGGFSESGASSPGRIFE